MRRTLFWLHLVAGSIAGLMIASQCITGTALAFEKQIVAWAERDARRVAVPAPATRLPLAELARRLHAAHPDAHPTAIVVAEDPRAAVTFQLGREGAFYANPYTGDISTPASTRVHDIVHALEEWHRWLALGGDRRPIGKAITGASALSFCFLACSGLYLWWPRSLSWRSVRSVALFDTRLAGRARDFNWHNTLGFWCAPVFIAITLAALPISYRWATDGLYRFFGETPPPPGPPAAPAFEIRRPEPTAHPLDTDALLARARTLAPHAESFTFRLGSDEARRPAGASPTVPQSPAQRPATIVVREPGAWPRTATTTLHLDPFTGEQLRREAFADLTPGRRARTWARYLHTGEALGWPGQLVAALAAAAGLVLVWTGFALAWRRFFRRPIS